MGNTLQYERIVDRKISLNDMRALIQGEPTNIEEKIAYIVAPLKDKIGNLLDYKLDNKNTFNRVIALILRELTINAHDSYVEHHETSTNRRKVKIYLRIDYNEERGGLLITMRDNGIGENSQYYGEDKMSSNLPFMGGSGHGGPYINSHKFVVEYKRKLGKKGAVIQLKIDLNKVV